MIHHITKVLTKKIIFWYQKKNREMVQADDVRDSLLELTQNGSSEMARGTAKNEDNGLQLLPHHLHNLHISSHLHHLA